MRDLLGQRAKEVVHLRGKHMARAGKLRSDIKSTSCTGQNIFKKYVVENEAPGTIK